MKKKTIKVHQIQVDIKEFIGNLMFEDAGTVLDKTYRFLKTRKDISGFGVDVDMKTSTVNAMVRVGKESLSFTIFEGDS